MERSGDFSGTLTSNNNILEECRVRCGQVQELFVTLDTEDDGHSQSEDMFAQAQEQAEAVQAFLETACTSLRGTLEIDEDTGDQVQAEKEAVDTLDRLNAVMAELTLEAEEEEGGFDDDAHEEKD